jgi:Flp pilus assembly pilin Flp
MTGSHTRWTELSDRLEALALKLKLHLEQTGDEEVPEALGRLRHAVEDAFEAAGNAVKDEAVRADVREVGQLLGEAVSTTFAKVSDEMRDLLRRKA